MNILNWNIRGMNASRKRQALSDYIDKYHIDMVAIQETKKEDFSNRILRSLSSKIDNWVFVPSVGRSGGILFGVDSSKIEIQSHSCHTFCLDVHLTNKVDQTHWQYTIVYGPTIRSKKREFWTELDQIRHGSHKLWIISGDFNAIRYLHEKSGCNFDIPISKMFNQFIHRHNLVEHKLHNRKYTWSNGTNFALLDRYFTSLDWDNQYPSSYVTDLSKNSSYHCPIVMHIDSSVPIHQTQFRLDPLWFDQEEFCRLVIKWWQEDPLRLNNVADSWNQKLGRLRRKIKGWAKNFYGAKKREKVQILDRLNELDILRESRPLSSPEVEEWTYSKARLEEIYLEEELYWKHRSKQKWLDEGDHNTKYFHVIANHRRNKNRIHTLDINDTPSSSLPEIKQHAIQYYQNILGTPGLKYATLDPHFWDPSEKVTQSGNEALIAPFSLEEIKHVFF